MINLIFHINPIDETKILFPVGPRLLLDEVLVDPQRKVFMDLMIEEEATKKYKALKKI